jgi:hypothetical protein
MLRKIVAALLLVLAASPFTAPFSTCDVATLMGGDTAAARYQSSLAPVVDHSQSAALCTAPRRSRMRLKTTTDGLVPAAALQPVPSARLFVSAARLAERACASPPVLTTLRI